MKKLQVLLVALLVVAAACTLFKKDIEVPEKFSVKLSRTAADDLAFAREFIIDTSSPDIDKYKDQIEEFRIDRITYTVSQFSGTNTPVVNGSLMFRAAGTATYKTLGAIPNLDLKASNTSGQEYTMALASDAVKNELINLMKSGSVIEFKLDGVASNNPVDATIDFKIYANMTVKL